MALAYSVRFSRCRTTEPGFDRAAARAIDLRLRASRAAPRTRPAAAAAGRAAASRRRAACGSPSPTARRGRPTVARSSPCSDRFAVFTPVVVTGDAVLIQQRARADPARPSLRVPATPRIVHAATRPTRQPAGPGHRRTTNQHGASLEIYARESHGKSHFQRHRAYAREEYCSSPPAQPRDFSNGVQKPLKLCAILVTFPSFQSGTVSDRLLYGLHHRKTRRFSDVRPPPQGLFVQSSRDLGPAAAGRPRQSPGQWNAGTRTARGRSTRQLESRLCGGRPVSVAESGRRGCLGLGCGAAPPPGDSSTAGTRPSLA